LMGPMRFGASRSFVGTLDRLHRYRWRMLRGYAIALAAGLIWLSGYAGEGMARFWNGERRLPWVAQPWTLHAAVRFLGLKGTALSDAAEAVTGEVAWNALVAGFLVIASAASAVWLARSVTRKSESWGATFTRAATVAIPLAFVLLPCVAVLFIPAFQASHSVRVVFDWIPRMRDPALAISTVGALWAIGCVCLWPLFRRDPYRRAVRTLSAVGSLSALGQILALPWFDRAPQLHFAAVYASCWAFGALLLVVFAWPGVRTRMRQECSACGYDLTGTLAAGIRACPECGAMLDGERSDNPQAA
jgi:hypothetical protein